MLKGLLNKLVLLGIICFFPAILFAQQELKHIREGNEYYESQDFEKARQSYLKGVEANADSYGAAFNLGDALYKGGQYEEAANHFQSLVQKATTSEQKAESYHNLGNALLETQKYQESIDAYKNALRNNPNDEATRYNLAYALQKLKEQQQQQQNQQNQENQDQQDQNQDQQQNQENQENQQDQNQENQENQQQQQDQQQQNKEGENQEQQAPPPQGISKEDAERLLEALQNQEQELQEELKKKKAKVKTAKVAKDW